MKRGMDGQMPVPGMGEMMGGIQETAADLIAAAESLDLTVAIEGTNVHLKGYFTAKAGSKLATSLESTAGLAPLAAALPGDYPMAMLFSMDMTQVMEWMKPFMDMAYEMYPEGMRDKMKSYMEAWMPLYEKMGDQHAFAMDMGDSGMAVVGVSTMKDAKGFVEEYKRIATEKGGDLATEMGVEFKFGQGRAVAGHEVHTLHVSFDWDKMMKTTGQDEQLPPEATAMAQQMLKQMFGEDGMQMRMVPMGDRLVWTFAGDDALLEQTIKAAGGTTAGGGIAKAIETAGGAPTFLLYLEGRNFAKGVLDMARKIASPEAQDDIPPAPADGKPVPLVMYGAVKGRHYMGGMSIDIGSVMELVQEFMK
jgi:hypothetical protein